MDPWYRVVTPRKEVREGRSFNPDEFAIALDQVVDGTAPEDYRDPVQFFSRTFFTQALREHTGTVLRRLSGRTENSAPVISLVTQFGGGKTHTLTSLYHLSRAGKEAGNLEGVGEILSDSGVSVPDDVRVATFVGNAWDPRDGNENPWTDLARQIGGERGVEALGATARTAPPGTRALADVFAAADAPVLILFDEVLNFINRHANMGEHFYAFLQNLTVAVAGTTRVAAVVSLPRSQIEMTETDREWQERIIKVVNRIAQDLIANDESEISEVVRRRLFEDLGNPRVHQRVARAYADWCFDRSARLPSEWTTVDTATNDTRARDHLRRRFEACYPFHPATLSVFQRKWSPLPQFQKTRGSLAMLAQWISSASGEQFRQARNEPLITLGSAPLHIPSFRETVLSQLGQRELRTAIEVDLAGETARARPLDADAKGALRDIHKRVGTAMLFESTGGQIDRVAHLPELRFALGEPDVETTTIDNAAAALAETAFFIRKVGTDGYRIHHQATLRKAVADLRASLDEETEVKPAIRRLVQKEFDQGNKIRKVYFPGGQQRRRGRPAHDPGGGEPRGGVAGERPHRRAHQSMDQGERKVAQAVPRSPGLVHPETGPGPAGQDGTLAGLAEGQERDRRRHHGPGVREAGAERPEPADQERRGRGGRRGQGQLPVRGPRGLPCRERAQDHRPGGRILPGRPHAQRARGRSAQFQRHPKRVRRGGLHREELAAGPPGKRGMATEQPAAKLPERVSDPAAGPGTRCSVRRSRSSWEVATLVWHQESMDRGTSGESGTGKLPLRTR